MFSSLKELLENDVAEIAKIPKKNDIQISELDDLAAYTVPIISHDYAAKTPIMWNSVYEKEGLNIKNIMIVANPSNAEIILDTFRKDNKYLGGGVGVGFKEAVLKYLDKLEPSDLKAVNIIKKEGSRLIGYNTDAMGFVKSLESKLMSINKKIEGGNFVVFGAGGVAKEATKLLAQYGALTITIINRTYSKAVDLAHYLNTNYRQVAIGVSENLSRGVLLNSEVEPDAIINFSDKGSDGKLENHAMFYETCEKNKTICRSILKDLYKLNPNVLIADIVLPKRNRSVSLRLAEMAGFKNLLDGTGMVINQAVPAYKIVHGDNLKDEYLLEIMKVAAES